MHEQSGGGSNSDWRRLTKQAPQGGGPTQPSLRGTHRLASLLTWAALTGIFRQLVDKHSLWTHPEGEWPHNYFHRKNKRNSSGGAELRYKKVCRREVSCQNRSSQDSLAIWEKSRKEARLFCFNLHSTPDTVEASFRVSCFGEDTWHLVVFKLPMKYLSP